MANQYAKNYALGSFNDILKTSTTIDSVYKLNDEVDIFDDTLNVMTKYKYVYARNALLAYGCYEITYAGTAGQEVGCLTLPNATLSIYTLMGVPQVACASGSYCWVAIKGYCKITSTTDTTKGDFGSAIKAIATCTDSGATLTTHSICTFEAARTGSGTVACNLLGNRVVIA